MRLSTRTCLGTGTSPPTILNIVCLYILGPNRNLVNCGKEREGKGKKGEKKMERKKEIAVATGKTH